MNSAHTADKNERARAYILAARADVDPRTALKALREGAQAVKTVSVRERIVAAMGSAA